MTQQTRRHRTRQTPEYYAALLTEEPLEQTAFRIDETEALKSGVDKRRAEGLCAVLDWIGGL